MKFPTGTILTISAALLIAILTAHSAQAQIYSVLYTFELGPDAIGPYAGVIRDSNGNLYGTTGGGGTAGAGTVYKLNTANRETVLYSFQPEPDGSGPAAIVPGPRGSVFGNTYYGGTYGFGTVYELSGAGERRLHNFTAGADGAYPQSPVVLDAQGNLYGAAFSYGGPSAGGTVFRINKTGQFSVLHTFMGGTDGSRPAAGLILDGAGNLYGTTEGGGNYGVGTVFMVNSNTGEETVLYSFKGGSDGENPYAPLILDTEGNFYGTTAYGGNAANGGIVFKLSKSGEETVLHRFTGRFGDGYNPMAGLARDSRGNLYGTTYYGGAYGAGTVFKLDLMGNETVLYSFTGGGDGGLPIAGLILDSEENLYGTTPDGGDLSCGFENEGCGVVFKLAQ